MKAQIYIVALLGLLATVFALNKCPAQDDDVPVYLRNPEDCKTFYQCLKGEAYLGACPSGLEWSVQLNRCVWRQVANCKVEQSAEECSEAEA